MFMGPRNWCQGMNSASLCSLAGRYENPIPPRCLAPIDFLKIPALDSYKRIRSLELEILIYFSRPVPEFIDPVFTKTSPKRSFSLNRKRAFWLVFAKTGSIISGTGFLDLDVWNPSGTPDLDYLAKSSHIFWRTHVLVNVNKTLLGSICTAESKQTIAVHLRMDKQNSPPLPTYWEADVSHFPRPESTSLSIFFPHTKTYLKTAQG